MRSRIGTAAFAAALALAASTKVAHAQKALVYCPVSIDASGCGRIVDALTSRFPDGVERGYDGTSGTVDLRKADLQHYAVFVVPSLADNDATKPYALLRELAPAFRMAINGRVAVYSGAPDQGAANRDAKNDVIGNLASWAADGHAFKTGLVGLVAFLDLSSEASERYSWVKGLSPLEVSADAELQSFSSVEALAGATSLLSKGGTAIAYGNMASLGLHIGREGAARASAGAIAGTASRQTVLVTYSLVGGRASQTTDGADVTRGASTATASLSTASTASANSIPTLTTDKADYVPGENVTFTGAGFGAGDTVVITLHEDPHWQDPDRTVTAIANASGGFTNSAFVVDQHDLGVTFTATAIGSPSGLSAQTTFTDGNVSAVSNTEVRITSATPGVCAATTPPSFAVGTEYCGQTKVTATSGGGTTDLFMRWLRPDGTPTCQVTASSVAVNGVYVDKCTLNVPSTATADWIFQVSTQSNFNSIFPGSIVVHVVAANAAPIAANDAYTTNEDSPLVVPVAGVLTNDTDADANTLTAVRPTGTTGPSNGTLTLNANGSFTYTPNANFNGTDNFTYFANDGTINSATAATVTITVNAVNDVPSFTKGADQTVLEDAVAQSVSNWATAISRGGGTDENGQVVDFIVTNDNNALFSVQPAVSATGTLTYTLAANANGLANVSVKIHDDGGTANTGVDTSLPQTLIINVTAVNDAPSFTKGADQTVNEDAGPQTVTPWATLISAGPANESGQTLTFAVTSNSNTALFSAAPAVSATGVLTYTPAANANGTATIKIKLTDNGGVLNGGIDASAEETFVINVTAVNDAPSFTKGADETVLEDAGAKTVTGWATAISAGPADEATQTVDFVVSNNNNALFSAQPAIAPNGTLAYTPAADAFGVATVTVHIHDNGGGTDVSADQTFTITVKSVNDAPSFTKGADQTKLEDAGAQTVPGWATAISKGPANEVGQTLTFNVTNNNNGLFSAQPSVDALGQLTYTPAANANGTATVTVALKDDGGVLDGGVDTSPSQTFTITITAVNDAPTFDLIASHTVLEDAAAQSVPSALTNRLAGPANESGQVLTLAVSNNNNALFSAQPAIDAGGTLTYTPAANASGSAIVTVVLSDDGGTANLGVDATTKTLTITVTPVNDAPSFTKGADQPTLEDAGPQTVPGWATAISAGPNEGSQVVDFQVSNNNNALFLAQPSITATGQLTYTAAPNANGSATVTVKLHDNGGIADGGIDLSAAQTFVITITAVNDAPSFTKGADQTKFEDAGAQTVNNWATALSAGPADEVGQTLSFEVTNDNNALFSVQPAIDASGNLTYTLAADAFGSTTVTVKLHDNGGTANSGFDTSAPQTFTITVTGVNDAPSFTKGADQTKLEDAGAQTVVGWATAISVGPPNESAQTIAFNVTGNTNATLFSVAPAISPTGTLTYTAAPDAFGSATITVVAQDNGGTANSGVDTSAPQSFTITITPVNDAPTFGLTSPPGVLEDAGAQSVPGTLTSPSAGPANESGQTLSLTVTNNNNPLFSVQPAIDLATGTLTYTPATNANGTATITVELKDNGGTAYGGVDKTTKMLTITVTAVNDAPSFTKGGDQSSLEDAGVQTVPAWATAISAGPADEETQTLNFIVTNNNNALFAAQPTISAAGILTYTAAPNANGSATVTVKLMDNGGTLNGGVNTSGEQTFTITITPVNDAPSFTKGANQTVLEDAAAQTVPGWATAISAGPVDEAAQLIDFVVGNNNNALFSVQPAVAPNGTLTYTPAANAYGTATVTIHAHDNGGTANLGVDASADQTFMITLTPVNDVPSFTKGANQSVNEDAGVQNVPGWATAISAGPNEASQHVDFIVTNDNNALFSAQPSVDATGKLTYTPAANANGSATVTVKIHDDGGLLDGGVDTSAPQTFTITVVAVNDAPSFTKGADQTKLEDAGAQTVPGWATGISAGPADEVGQAVDFVVSNNNNALFSVQPAVASDGTLTYTLAANANGAATVTIHAHDNGGTANTGVDASADQTFSITVTAVNDIPSFTKGADQTKLEDAGAQTVAGWATSISKGPANESAQAVDFIVTNNNNVLFSSQPAIDPSGQLTYTAAANANGSATVTVKIHDNGGTSDGGVDTSAPQTFTITITAVNDAPTFALTSPPAVSEDASAQSVANTLTAQSAGPPDESGQTFTLTVTNSNNGLFSAQPAIDLTTGTLTYTPAPNANGTATVTVKLKDSGGMADGGVDETTKTLTITVNPVNDAPVITDFSSPLPPNAANASVGATGSFQDIDLGDASSTETHTGTIDWGDGATTPVTITGASGTTRNFSGSHTYAAAGVYTLIAYIKDKAGAVDDSVYKYVVVYDPGAGFVTGGGWITSPLLAYAANPSLTGKATFGFVSKYKKGQSTPDGDTEFQFQAAGFNFKSTSYEWLVVAGAKAQYKGSGTINGSGDYFFMLTAIDGELKGKSADTFRMKVWNKTTLAVIYDNLVGAPDTADPVTVLGGGSIQIHDK